jgi:hypothetical protein
VGPSPMGAASRAAWSASGQHAAVRCFPLAWSIWQVGMRPLRKMCMSAHVMRNVPGLLPSFCVRYARNCARLGDMQVVD